MAYNRYEQRRGGREGEPRGRDEDQRWRSEEDDRFAGGDRHERGFFERAGDEVASWFGSDEAEQRRQRDNVERQGGERSRGRSGLGRDEDDRGRFGGGQSYGRGRDAEADYGRGSPSGSGEAGGFGRSGYGRTRRHPRYADGWSGSGMGPGMGIDNSGIEYHGPRDVQEWERSYRPFAGDLGRSESWEGRGGSTYGVDRTQRDHDEWRRSEVADDPHYQDWRRRQMESLDRDYDEYRRENQSRFNDDFTAWRERRQGQRQMLGQVREQMEVVGNDNGKVGTVDHVAGDRIILTRGDDPSGAHHSLMCSMVDRVEGNQVLLNTSADKAKERWRDESRERALFEREDQGSAGPGMLNRSFSGTYR